MKRTTQTDVARLAGVSRATVSYVVNDLQDNQVSEETRQKVLRAVHELGYQPDAMAQSLRLGMTNTIGLLIPDMDNPHYWQIAKGVEIEAQSADYDLLLISTSLDPDRERHSIRALSRRRVDGLILILSFVRLDDDAIRQLARQKKPLVLMNGTLDHFDVPCDVVSIDEGQGALEAMRHLLDLGHRRIGMIYGVAHPGLGSPRLRAYCDALQGAGRVVDEDLIARCGTTPEDGYQAALHLMRHASPPTALLVINDLLAIGALRALADRGLRVPQDVSVVSFDDIALAIYMQPRLTTVGINATNMGQAAAHMIFNRLRDPNLPPQTTYVTSRLILRDSTGTVS
jgi:LacI family transcriptional regulator